MRENIRIKKTEEFIEKVKLIHGEKYEYDRTVYTGMEKNVVIFCKECGEYTEILAKSLLKGCTCKKCSIKRQRQKLLLSNDEFIRRSKEIFGDNAFDYSLVEYDGHDSKIKLICNKHNRLFEQTAGSHLSGYCGCPSCVNHKCENKIDSLLRAYNVSFNREKVFSWLKYNSYLRLDFYLCDYNIAIEYQGEQHFHAINFSGCSDASANEEFNNANVRDKVKKDLCDKHGIKIYYINYYDNIDESVYSILKDIGHIDDSVNIIHSDDCVYFENSDNIIRNNFTDSSILQIDHDGNIICEYNDIYEISEKCGFNFTPAMFKHLRTGKKDYKGYYWKIKDIGFIYKILQYDLNGNFINSFINLKSASDETGCSYYGIKNCVNDKQRTSGGYVWKGGYVYDPGKIRKNKRKKPIIKYDLDGNLVKEYESISDACDRNKQKRKNIKKVLDGLRKTAYGFVWKYKDQT